MGKDIHVCLDGNGHLRSGPARIFTGSLCSLFSSARSMKVGAGTTARQHASKIYWFIRLVGENTYGVRGVDSGFLPFGEEILVSSDDLLRNYSPEVACFEDKMLPAIKRERYRLESDPAQSWLFGCSGLKIDERNVRGLFELGVEYLRAGRTASGKLLVKELLALRTPFFGRDQFLFNEFGIALRKMGLYEAAATCYRRALGFVAHDENLYYNLARVHYEQGMWWDCLEALGKCFELNPELQVSRDLVELIVALAGDPALLARYGKPPVPEGVARRVGLLAEANVFISSRKTGASPVKPDRRTAWVREEGESDAGWNKTEPLVDIAEGFTG